ncbi:hypothetical protein L227DRAFT_616546 [Lentinus tigrinus ALCF2SS1-6]|uniref:Uncharacterized protein n=1 Tax=Lentinus tigrinus ALCF2SS1-6 TaxID=1328759 RepID=A0A5C2RRP5_9APHY|nr:hypothetical protein L227DRAFT_616546 [Lentinus tigrinus ALCF2SS1-6]
MNTSVALMTKTRKNRKRIPTPDTQSYSQAVRLLHLVADDLESLVLPSTLMSPQTSHILGFGARPFPSLRTLVINVPRDLGRPALESSAASLLFPLLTHLHIVMASDSSSVGPVSDRHRHAPHTTHLRISYCPLLGNALEDVRLLLGTPSYPHKMGRRPVPVHPPPSTREWPTLRPIAIQPLPSPHIKSAHCGNVELSYWNLRSALSWMADWAKKEDVVDALVLKPVRAKRASVDGRARVRQAWERLITSGVDSDWFTFGDSEEDEDSGVSEGLGRVPCDTCLHSLYDDSQTVD